MQIYVPRRNFQQVLTLIKIISCRTLRQGMHDLKVWPNIEADGSRPTTTPGKTSGKEDEMGRLAKVGDLSRCNVVLLSDTT